MFVCLDMFRFAMIWGFLKDFGEKNRGIARIGHDRTVNRINSLGPFTAKQYTSNVT